jgi:hypothetical protein
MIKITPYSESAVQQLFEQIERKHQNDIRVEYEVRVGNEQITPRTADLSEFFDYREFLNGIFRTVEFWFYKGNSRRYDKYVFEVQEEQTQETIIQNRIDEALEKARTQFQVEQLGRELKLAQEKNKELREDKRELKERIKILESDSKQSAMADNLLNVFKQSQLSNNFSGEHLSGINGATIDDTFHGIPVKELLNTLNDLRKDLGDENFQTYLGTTLTLGKYPELIPAVRKLIEEQRTSAS